MTEPLAAISGPFVAQTLILAGLKELELTFNLLLYIKSTIFHIINPVSTLV